MRDIHIMSYWVNDIKSWLIDPRNSDQNRESKCGFVRTAKAGQITKLHALGISNPKLKAKAREFYNENKTIDFTELLNGMNSIFVYAKYTESRMFPLYILDRFKKQVYLNSSTVFDLLNKSWIDEVDHWTTSDHICINLMAHLNYSSDNINEIISWGKSSNFWRQRLSMTAFLKHAKSHPEYTELVLNQVTILKNSKNYYVRKAFSWIISTYARAYPDKITAYIPTILKYLSKTELRESIKHLDKKFQSDMIKVYDDYKSQR